MHPWLVRLDVPGFGPVAIPSYFVLLLLGVVVAVEFAIREARRESLPPRRVLQLAAAAVVSGLVGARVTSLLLLERTQLLSDPAAVLLPWNGGMVWYGGALAGSGALILLARRWQLAPWRVLDVFAVPALAGLAVGRLGCLAAGCCYGRPIDWGTGIEWPWGVTFLAGQVPDVLRGFPLHPTQAYASINAAVLAALVWRLRGRQRFVGQAAAAALVAYGVTRSLLELFRLDTGRGFLLESLLGPVISTSQVISLPLIAVGLWHLTRHRTRPA